MIHLFSCAVLIAVLALSGCSVSRPDQNAYVVDAKFSTKIYPPVNQVTSARVGDELITTSLEKEVEMIKILKPVKVIPLLPRWIIMPGVYEKCGMCNEFTLYKVSARSDGGSVRCLVLANDPLFIAMDRRTNDIGVVTHGMVSETRSISTEVFAVIKGQVDVNQRSVLKYLGITGTTIKLVYEVYNERGLLSLSNEAFFDLRKSSVIQYKEYVIRVIDAGNGEILYQRVNGESEMEKVKLKQEDFATKWHADAILS